MVKKQVLFAASKPARKTKQQTHFDAFFENVKTQPISIEIWLILPVVICLFQGLSHACLRITAPAGICVWLITSDVICRKYVAVYPLLLDTLLRNAKLIHESNGRFHWRDRGLGQSLSEEPCEWMTLRPMPSWAAAALDVLNQFIPCESWFTSVFWRTTALSCLMAV